MLSDFEKACLQKVAKNEGFVDFSIQTTTGSKHGDNFLGVMTAITLSGTKDQNGVRKQDSLYLICKSPPLGEIRKKFFNFELLFEREIQMYSKVLPAFVRFQQEKGLSEADSFLAYPKVFMCEASEENDSYILIMEDLRAKNFVMWPKEEMITLDHELLVLRKLAKFHAISFAMKDQRPDEFNEFKCLNDVFYKVLIDGSLKKWFKTVLDRAIEGIENLEHKNLMKNFRQIFLDRMKHLLTELPNTEISIMLHGDCWNNNILFQYSGENRNGLKGINFVDWQLSYYGSPAVDVLHNIFTSTDKKFRDQHHETLLNAYYTSLSETIRKLGSDPDKLYTFKQFQKQLEKFGEFALLFAPIMYTVRLADENDVLDVDEYVERLANGEDVDLMQCFSGEKREICYKLINGAVTDLINYGYVKGQTHIKHR